MSLASFVLKNQSRHPKPQKEVRYPLRRALCGLCRKPINPDSKEVLLFGKLGPECVRKVEALPQFLARYDLAAFGNGPVSVSAVLGTDGEGADTWMVPRGLLEARARALRLGLVLRLEPDMDDDPPLIRAWLELPDVVGSRAALVARLNEPQLGRVA